MIAAILNQEPEIKPDTIKILLGQEVSSEINLINSFDSI
jgi:hypothetical protein